MTDSQFRLLTTVIVSQTNTCTYSMTSHNVLLPVAQSSITNSTKYTCVTTENTAHNWSRIPFQVQKVNYAHSNDHPVLISTILMMLLAQKHGRSCSWKNKRVP